MGCDVLNAKWVVSVMYTVVEEIIMAGGWAFSKVVSFPDKDEYPDE